MVLLVLSRLSYFRLIKLYMPIVKPYSVILEKVKMVTLSETEYRRIFELYEWLFIDITRHAGEERT